MRYYGGCIFKHVLRYLQVQHTDIKRVLTVDVVGRYFDTPLALTGLHASCFLSYNNSFQTF